MDIRVVEVVERADVLVVGGGIAGLQAAIEAADAGASVIVLEKADTRRSGNGATGNDHFMCYLPEVHGPDFQACVDQVLDTMEGPNQDRAMLERLLWRSREIVEKWQGYGIDMKPYGPEYLWEGHTLPGRQHFHLKYDGSNQKPALTRAARARGVRIRNHTTAVELLLDAKGAIAGAIAIDASEDAPRLVCFEALAVVLACAGSTRAFPNLTPQAPFNLNGCPACAGGSALAYNAGARFVNLDTIGQHAGPKFFQRSGKATWLGVFTDSTGEPVGPYVRAASRALGDPFSDVYPGVFDARQRSGAAPTYNDNRALCEEDLAYMRHCFVTEGDTSINDYLDQRGIDLRRDMVEFGSYGYAFGLGGMDVDLDAQSTVAGLFGAGTVLGNVRGNITCASVFGMIAGESAAASATRLGGIEAADATAFCELAAPRVAARARMYGAFLARPEGSGWREANAALQNIMGDYAGGRVRSATLLTAGLRYIRQLRRQTLAELSCANSHELVRATEVLGLMDICEAAVLCSRNRRETRGGHKRSDYPYQNVLLNDHYGVIERRPGGGARMGFRKNVRRAASNEEFLAQWREVPPIAGVDAEVAAQGADGVKLQAAP